MFGNIHIIEWLWETGRQTRKADRRTGQELYREVRKMLTTQSCQLRGCCRVGSCAAFLACPNRIEQDFNRTRRIPLLQIETHGDGHSIGLSDDDGLPWPELMKALCAAEPCHGLALAGVPVILRGHVGHPDGAGDGARQFFALMGPKRKMFPGELVRGMRAFYQKVIVERNGLKAMEYMNSIVNPDEDTFRIYNCEQLFRDVGTGTSKARQRRSTSLHVSKKPFERRRPSGRGLRPRSGISGLHT